MHIKYLGWPSIMNPRIRLLLVLADFVAKVGCIRRMLVSHAVEATDFGVPA